MTAIPLTSEVTEALLGVVFGTLSVEVSVIRIFEAAIPSSLVAI